MLFIEVKKLKNTNSTTVLILSIRIFIISIKIFVVIRSFENKTHTQYVKNFYI